MNRHRKLRIGVKYCGGCNPSYDRVALVKRMEKTLVKKAEFISFQEENVDLVLVVCGCETGCVDTRVFEVPVHLVSSIPDGDRFVERLIREASPETVRLLVKMA